MTDRTGILPNSPLAYTIASVRFAPWHLMSAKIAEIHDDLRTTFPLIQSIKVQLQAPATTNIPVESSAWVLQDANRSVGVLLAPEQMLFISTDYSRYSDFAELQAQVCEVLLKRMRFFDITNIGTRYIDHIKPTANEKAEDYISTGLLPPSFPWLKRVGGTTQAIYAIDDAELRIRCVTQPGVPSVPDDLIGLLLMINEPGKNLDIKLLGNDEILLDIDALQHYATPERRENTADILQELNSLHTIANRFFRHQDVCTEHAFTTWKRDVP